MEFYFILYVLLRVGIMFQFPTGWNSTLYWVFPVFALYVSIPTGMEFYQVVKLLGAVCEKFQFPTGWNSTLSLSSFSLLLNKVSIPNGMEFYSSTAE